MPKTLNRVNLKVRDPRKQITDPNAWVDLDLLNSNALEQIDDAKDVALTEITAIGTTQANAVIAAGTAAVANFPATAAACDTLAGDFAATYVPDQAYAVGDYCTYQYQLYQCKTAIAANTDHTFVTSHWNLITVTDTINDQVDDLKESVGYITGNVKVDHWSDNHQYIANNGTSIAIPFTPSSATSNVRWLAELCAEGDIFTITATGGNSSRAYCFVDAQGTILQSAAAAQALNDLFLVAPANSAYIIVNDTTLAGSVYKGILCNKQITAAANAINGDLELANKTDWVFGSINNSTGADINNSSEAIRSGFIAVLDMKRINIIAEAGYTLTAYCYVNPRANTFISGSTYTNSFDVPDGCNYIRLRIAKTGSSQDLDFVNHVSVVGLYKINLDIKDLQTEINLDIKDLQTEQEKTTQIANLLDGDDPTAGLEWHTGSIGSSGSNNDSESSLETRIRIPNAMADAAKLAGYTGIRVHCNTGYQGVIRFYKDDGNGGSSYSGTATYNEWTLMVDIPEDALYARFVLLKNGNTNISVSEGDNVKFALVTEVVKTVRANEDFKKAARLNPVIQFMCRDGRAVPTVPPDSIFAIKAAADNGYDRIRFSVRKSMNSRGSDDYTYVCIHDENIKNIVRNRTDGSAVTENIDPDTKTLEELDGYDWGLAYGSQYRGLKTPRLDDCLKYATLYNLKAALDFKWSYLSDTEVDDITTMLAKYGQYEALIMVHPIASKQKFAARIKELSQDFVAETLQEFQSAKTNLSGLLTGKNHVYLFPKNSNPIVPSQDIINFAAANGFDIMTSELSSIAALAAFGFDKGITLFECHNIPNIKETVNAYVNGLVSEELEALGN